MPRFKRRVSTHQEGFAIYLPTNDVSPDAVKSLDEIQIGPTPLISMEDIISYERFFHFVHLTGEAYRRLMELEIPPSGKIFVVCVNHRPIYWGCFWFVFSSRNYDGVVIPVPLVSPSATISLELGYPSRSFVSGGDPRDNPLIMEVLRRAGKLV